MKNPNPTPLREMAAAVRRDLIGTFCEYEQTLTEDELNELVECRLIAFALTAKGARGPIPPPTVALPAPVRGDGKRPRLTTALGNGGPDGR